MNITDRPNHVEYVATAAQTAFGFAFLLQSASDLEVKVNDVLMTYANPATTALEYGVSIVPGIEGGSITFGAGRTLNDVVTLQRKSVINRQGAFSTSGPIDINALNALIDRLVLYSQDNRELASRGITAATGEDGLILPILSGRASKLLGFDGAGDFAVYTLPTISLGNVTSGAAAIAVRGTPTNPIFDFTLQTGEPGTGATVSIGTVATGAPGSSVIITNVGTAANAVLNITIPRGADGGGSGSVTSFSFTNANGVSGSVLNATSTPALTITLGAITPSSVAASGTVTGSNLSGTNTGDQFTNLTSSRILGRVSGGFGAAQELTGTQVTALLDSATGSLPGLMTAAQFTKLAGIATGATLNPYPLGFFFQGKQLVASEVLCGLVSPFATTLVQANCVAKSLVAATASTTFTIKNNGVSIGTVVFAAAASTGTVTITTAAVVAGDFLTLHGPAGADTTLSDVGVTLR